MGSILGSGRSPGEEHGNSLQYSCLEHPTGRGAWQATVHSVAKSWTRLKQLSTHTQAHCSFFFFFLKVKFKIPGSGMSSWMTSAMVSFLSSELSLTYYVFLFQAQLCSSTSYLPSPEPGSSEFCQLQVL